MRIVDLSATIRHSADEVPEHQRTEIRYTSHAAGARQIESLFGVPSRLLRGGEGWAVEEFLRLGTHNSTHVDAPWHYNSAIGGRRAATIDELPLEWFYGDGVVLDMRHKKEGDAVTREEVIDELERTGTELNPLDIVLVFTGCDAFYDDPRYMFRGCGVTAGATHYLYEQGVRVMGIDAWGWDAPLDRQAEAAREAQASGVFWAAHQAGLAYSQIERLCNLGALPAKGFKVACFPLKIEGGSAAPARVVAILP